MRAMFWRYAPDALVIALLGAGAAAAGIWAHGATKIYTGVIAGSAPVVFAVLVFALFAVAALGKRLPRKAAVQRVLVDLAIASVFVPSAFLEVEGLFAPAELARHTDIPTVVARIAANEDIPRLKAWARLRTMSKDEQAAAAAALAPLLTGDDEGARRSAALTLDVALRRQSIATLVALAPELKAFFTSRKGGSVPPTAARAADFTRRFVEVNAPAVRRALQEENRAKLPPGGAEALMIALASDEDGIGRKLLEAYAAGAGDEDLRPLARNALALINGTPAT